MLLGARGPVRFPQKMWITRIGGSAADRVGERGRSCGEEVLREVVKEDAIPLKNPDLSRVLAVAASKMTRTSHH